MERFDLPEHWATALLYGDESGLDDCDTSQILAWEKSTGFDTLICVSVDSEDSGDFRRYHDAQRVGVLACHVARFTFDVGAV